MGNNNTITIVGGGSSAHVLIPLLSKAGHKVNVLTRRPSEWSRNVEAQLQSCDGHLKKTFKGTINFISNNPQDIIPQASIIVLCMPVSQYRQALHHIAPYINDNKNVFVGALYGQAGFNWMMDEIKKKYNIKNITSFAIGLLPWICRTVEYGRVGVTYGPKKVNIVALSDPSRFDFLNDYFLKNLCERIFDTGSFVLSKNFLSLTLSVDNQIIHPARCYGLFLKHGGRWKSLSDVPYFYRDFDSLSANILRDLDAEYTLIRNVLKTKYPKNDFTYMLDYLALERLSYQSENVDICESFTTSHTLGAIKTPTVQNDMGEWIIDTEHRFFTDDIHYGLCIAKWISEKLELTVPVIDSIIEWVQNIRHEKIIDAGTLLPMNKYINNSFTSGVPTVYGFTTIDEIVD